MKPTILLVEDEVNDVFFMKRAFGRASMPAEVRVAPDGREALRYLRGEGEYADRERHPLPCLTLLDLNLPYVHGLEVLRQIREEPHLRKLVVVVLTSSLADSDIERAYDLGANSYLTKPNALEGFQELAELIGQYWLNRNRVANSALMAGRASKTNTSPDLPRDDASRLRNRLDREMTTFKKAEPVFFAGNAPQLPTPPPAPPQ